MKGESGATRRQAALAASDTSGGDWETTWWKGASSPPGRSTCAALAAPATGSTQCQAVPATTASNSRPAGSHSSNVATSASTPVLRANSAILASGSTPSTRQPAAWNCLATMPVPVPTSSTSVPGLAAMIRSAKAAG